jgi:uncharacterized membrane protein YjfL (UPF0719 family)
MGNTLVTNEFSILLFFTLFVIILNIISIGYGETYISNADFINANIQKTYNADIFSTLGFMLFVSIPSSSNISNAITIYRIVYWTIILPYILITSYILARFVRGI